MDIDPQAVIEALGRQIGALHTENTVLKLALSQAQTETNHLSSAIGIPDGASDSTNKGKKKDAPAKNGDA